MHTANTLRNQLGIVRVRFRFFDLRLFEAREEVTDFRLTAFLFLGDKIRNFNQYLKSKITYAFHKVKNYKEISSTKHAYIPCSLIIH